VTCGSAACVSKAIAPLAIPNQPRQMTSIKRNPPLKRMLIRLMRGRTTTSKTRIIGCPARRNMTSLARCRPPRKPTNKASRPPDSDSTTSSDNQIGAVDRHALTTMRIVCRTTTLAHQVAPIVT